MRRYPAFLLVLPVLPVLLVAACGATSPRPQSDLARYAEPGGRFSIEHPRGWPLMITRQDGVDFWRWTPGALSSPDASAEADLAFAIVPLPPIPEAKLREASLDEVGQYVRDILIMSAREEGATYGASPGRRLELSGRPAVRFDLKGTGKDGVAARITAIVVNAGDAAAVVSFGGTAARLASVGSLLERSAVSLRLGD